MILLSPLPPGEGQGEGVFDTERASNSKTPSPRPLPEGEGEMQTSLRFFNRLQQIRTLHPLHHPPEHVSCGVGERGDGDGANLRVADVTRDFERVEIPARRIDQLLQAADDVAGKVAYQRNARILNVLFPICQAAPR